MPNFWTEMRRLKDQLQTAGPRLTTLAAFDKLTRFLQLAPPKQFSQVTSQILLGGQPAKRVLRWLKRKGVTGVVNLRQEYDYSETMSTLGIRYLHLPTPDNQPPTLEHLNQGVIFIHDTLAKGGRVYIHCWEGLGRSPTVVAAYLVSTGLTPNEAWIRIRKTRPFIRPTPGQVTRLEEFALQIPHVPVSNPAVEQIPPPPPHP
ncbi:MAG TPA: dual specificity protein phosphatase [Phototrophicaceae bacterium]|nr:dual specificity protein phosphatase [Phototrophicaceae bacterium]